MTATITTVTNTDPLGRSATSPTDFTLTAWKDIASRVLTQFSDDRIPLVAASAAFYLLLALVPSLAALVSIYGLVFNPEDVVQQMASLQALMPAEVHAILTKQLERLTAEPSRALGFAVAGSLGLSIWSASAATKSIMQGLNIVYDEREKRSFLQFNATALAITIVGLIMTASLVAVTVAMPIIVGQVDLHPFLANVIGYIGLACVVWLGLIALYRWGPSRADAKWKWLALGTVVALLALIMFSIGFSWFARTFASYSSYGSLGAVIAFMTWAWINMIILLLGAELNAEMEHQTAIDTTTGTPRPLGFRGAKMADTVSDRVQEPANARGSDPSPAVIAVAGLVAGATLASMLSRR